MPDNDPMVEPPLDALDWQIAFEVYEGHPGSALTLAHHLMVIKSYLQSESKNIPEALAAIDRAVDSLFEHKRVSWGKPSVVPGGSRGNDHIRTGKHDPSIGDQNLRMGTRPRPKPKHLPAKLLAIRQKLGASQSEMAKLLEFKKGCARMSEYESGAREPDLLLLLRYARLAHVSVDVLIDDELELRL